MRAADWREALDRLPFGTLRDLVGGSPFLVVAPHPDDEALGCGGLLAAAADAGIPAHVVVLTDGAASHRASPTYPPARLAALRRRESEAAAARLGVPRANLSFLDLPDTSAPREGLEFDRAVAAVVAIARNARVETLLVTSRHDPHCDHEAADAIARAVTSSLGAVRLWAYPIWSLHLAADTVIEDAPPRGWRFDITRWRGAKHDAIRCYASQMTDLIADDQNGFVFTPAQLASFLRDTEVFVEPLR